MNRIVKQLQKDHCQLTKVLFHLDREVSALSAPRAAGSKACNDKVLEILSYIQIYPELWHHPAEDIIYLEVCKAIPEKEALLKSVIEEHDVLALLTELLVEEVNAVAAGIAKSPIKLMRSCRHYIDRQLQHIQVEQELVAPLVKQLSDENWENIEAQLAEHTPHWQDREVAPEKFDKYYHNIVESHALTATQVEINHSAA